MKICVYGGHYGSEGKGAAAEFFIAEMRLAGNKIAAFGENSPNSGHTCSLGKTKNIPASAFFADVVVLGPDTVIDLATLTEDLAAVRAVNPKVEVYLHEHAAWMGSADKQAEAESCLVESIGSTGSGSGSARAVKYFSRSPRSVCSHNQHSRSLLALGVRLVNRSQWVHLVHEMLANHDWIFECSQGVLLDTNHGIYPFVTSRSTLPRVAIERNGLGGFPWVYAGVFRTFPIRTGGNSGPTGGKETSFVDIGVEMEIATVTKRVRRVFEFNHADFKLSLRLARPDIIMFTHCDYLVATGQLPVMPGPSEVLWWLLDQSCEPGGFNGPSFYASFEAGKFLKCHDVSLVLDRKMAHDMAMSA